MKSKLWIFISCKIHHVRPKKYKTKCELPNAFISEAKALLKPSNAAEIDTTVTAVKKANANADAAAAAASAAKTLKLLGRVTKKQKTKTKMTNDFVNQVLSVMLPHMEKSETTAEAVDTIIAALNPNVPAPINDAIHNDAEKFVDTISNTNVVVRYAMKAPLVVGAKEPAAKRKATKRKASASNSTPKKAAKPTKSKRKATPVDDDDDSSDSSETSMASNSTPKVAQRNKPKRQATLVSNLNRSEIFISLFVRTIHLFSLFISECEVSQ